LNTSLLLVEAVVGTMVAAAVVAADFALEV
jgi:hypothetical protein